ncbi:MAG: site-specific DNA-methyltransferase [Rhodanobacteraceae bacterium]|nr:site-specific DNA-methyltransferase [Rhodanobacteraceae bacterium]
MGKRAPASVQAFPAQWVESYGQEPANGAPWEQWPDGLRRGGLLYHGDNKEVLAHLLANGFRGQVKLIYIDPPFDSGADYVRKVELRGPKGKVKLDGEDYTLGEQIQYTDIWANDNYLQFMYERLLLMKELMAAEGSIYLHVDWRRSSQLRMIMDEVFGSDNFLNEVVWHFPNKIQGNIKRFATNHNNLLLYAKDKNKFTFHRLEEERDKPIKVNRRYWDAKTGFFATERDENGNVLYTERKERVVDDVWVIPAVSSDENTQLDYPTQKPEQLLERALVASSNPNDLILDCFIGSGTTASVAQKLGRRWIGCDINKGAIQTTAKLLQRVMAEQAVAGGTPAQGSLLGEGAALSPAQIGFSHWRVNDYDLGIQHNEAVALACEYLGVERLRNYSHFDGLLGKRLVKIIPFGHPLSPMDLEAIRNELDARPDEDRAITLVCLGKELAADAWLAEWNRLRKKKTDPHHIEVIELRNDPKLGGFLQHEKAQARVAVKRKGGKLHVAINDFVSPGILSRLAQQSGVVQPKVADWRAMVDSVMIDTAFDGVVFNVAHADVPARKTDFVVGEYELDAPNGEASVAVKITDMLGEEVLVTQAV